MKICNFPFIHYLKQLKSLYIILKLFLIFKILSCSAPLHPVLKFIWWIQQPITRGEQLSCTHVTAFSLTSLFLEQMWGEFSKSFKSLQEN